MNTKEHLEWSALWQAMGAHPQGWISTTAEMYEAMLNVLPPRAMADGRFLVGEPYDHNMDGEAVYACFARQGDVYRAKYLTVREFRKCAEKA